MSYSPSTQPNVTKLDWLSRIENMKVNRKDMNKLIMNYLVSGMYLYQVKYEPLLTCLIKVVVYFID